MPDNFKYHVIDENNFECIFVGACPTHHKSYVCQARRSQLQRIHISLPMIIHSGIYTCIYCSETYGHHGGLNEGGP